LSALQPIPFPHLKQCRAQLVGQTHAQAWRPGTQAAALVQRAQLHLEIAGFVQGFQQNLDLGAEHQPGAVTHLGSQDDLGHGDRRRSLHPGACGAGRLQMAVDGGLLSHARPPPLWV
jgi:hypothetical protein